MKKRVSLLSFLSALTLLCSCTTLGSNVYIHQPQMIGGIKYVGVAPVSMSEMDKFRLQRRIMPTQLLTGELRKRNLFAGISSDFLSKYAQNIPGTVSDKAVFLNLAKDANLDAVIFSELKYFTKQGMENAEFHIKIMEVSTGKLVVESTHNTFSGNTYWTQPTLEKVTHDAINGALKGIAQKWNKK